MRRFRIILSFILLLVAAGNARAGDSTVLGTGIGAAVGGLFGSQFGHGSGQWLTTGTGIVVGGIIGNSVGQSMEPANATPVYSGGYRSYEEASPIIYQPDAPNYVAPPTPPPIYIDDETGSYCREFSQRIRIDGRMQESYGTACLQADGRWRIMP